MRTVLVHGLTFAAIIISLTFGHNRTVAEDLALPRGPVSPEESLQHLRLHPDLSIELVASEPQVVDPVAMAFDEHGVLWVVEMSDYPHGPDDGGPPLSRIKRLMDQDGDGFFEQSEVFAENLLFANGVQPWRGGVIVTRAEQVVYMKDTDGDGRADVDEVWFEGFVAENPQLRANHPTFAIDNQIYVANGLRGGSVVARKSGWERSGDPLSISGRDFRFDPRTGEHAAITGNGQFGMTFDRLGNRFICSNRNPCRQIVLEDEYIAKASGLPIAGGIIDVMSAGEESRIYALSRAWTTSTLHAGQFTAACGVTIYTGDALPAAFAGNGFTCDPTGNLVHREVLHRQGVAFTGTRPRKEVEFLASPDEWFRPVNMAHGPDGGLYVVDMYRAVIEHPQFMPTELKTRRDLRDGDDRGRIYRLVAKHPSATARNNLNLAAADAETLASQLASTNDWTAGTAQRLLIERPIPAIADQLKAMVLDKTSPESASVRALHVLNGWDLLTVELLSDVLEETVSPAVAAHAARLGEPLANNASLAKSLRTRASVASDPAECFQLALSLGSLSEFDGRAELLAGLVAAAEYDPWCATAAALSAGNSVDGLFGELWQRGLKQPSHSEAQAVIKTYAEYCAIRPEWAASAIAAILGGTASVEDRPLRQSALTGLGKALQRRGGKLDGLVTGEGATTLQTMLAAAVSTAADESADVPARLDAVALLGCTAQSESVETLLELQADPRVAPSVRLAAVDALRYVDDPRIAAALMDDLRSRSPAFRSQVLDVLLARSDRTTVLLDHLEQGSFPVPLIDAARSQQLLRSRDADLRARAAKLLQQRVATDRQQVIDDYTSVLAIDADPLRGKLVFEKNCSTCHRIGEWGTNVGPDIGDSRSKTPENLLMNILDPNRAVDNNFFGYAVATIDGRVLSGIVSSETASSITLRQAGGKEETLPRDQIEEMVATGQSFMPVGVERTIPKQDMADLISFIKNWRYLDGSIPLSAK